MNATMSDGETYSGHFLQITKDTTAEAVGPLWDGSGGSAGKGGIPDLDGWRNWTGDPPVITHYTSRVVANLTAPSGIGRYPAGRSRTPYLLATLGRFADTTSASDSTSIARPSLPTVNRYSARRYRAVRLRCVCLSSERPANID